MGFRRAALKAGYPPKLRATNVIITTAVITRGLVRIGLLKGEPKKLIADGKYRRSGLLASETDRAAGYRRR